MHDLVCMALDIQFGRAILTSSTRRLAGDQGRETTMRKTFVECKSYQTARRRCPWAAIIAKADGGYWAFESVEDYAIWRNQR